MMSNIVLVNDMTNGFRINWDTCEPHTGILKTIAVLCICNKPRIGRRLVGGTTIVEN